VKEHHTASGHFRNPWPTRPPEGHTRFLRWALAHRTTRPTPVDPDRSAFSLAAPEFARPRATGADLVLTWVGHSTFLVQVGGLNILTDPMWSDRASPIPFVGPRRWVKPGIAMHELPPIDVVVLSHDHYDHLDKRSVNRMARLHAEARWLAPLGLGRRLRQWGAQAVAEMDWWEELGMHGVLFACVPAQHYSARGLRERWRSLWCGWVMRADEGKRVYFAGDTAYFPEFAAIGARYGPFDAALMPIAGYLPRDYMKYVHLSPEDAVRAFTELRAAAGDAPDREPVFVPMHWGTFKLSDEAMDEPVMLLERAWRERGAAASDLWLLMHGETRTRQSDPVT
jgi:N-acyl-phosphatidylethanolamine-hydrolysing phospholipase D